MGTEWYCDDGRTIVDRPTGGALGLIVPPRPRVLVMPSAEDVLAAQDGTTDDCLMRWALSGTTETLTEWRERMLAMPSRTSPTGILPGGSYFPDGGTCPDSLAGLVALPSRGRSYN